jgi:L-aminopeptidase/D-esterase-like protein
MNDGDTLFALATGRFDQAADVSIIGALAADVVAEAVLNAVRQATGLPGLPAVRDLAAAAGR